MALVATRVLVINGQLSFAVAIKRTLEQVGGFEVSPFTTADAALEYLSVHPQDVAIVDLTLSDMPGPDIVFRLRNTQPDLALIASPRSPDVDSVVHDLDLQGSIDVPISARELIPLIEAAVAHMHDVLPDTAQAPALVEESETLLIAPPDLEPRGEAVPAPPPPDVPEFSSLDSVLMNMGGFVTPPETLPVDTEDTPVEAAPEMDTAAFRQQSQPIEVRLTDTPKSGSRPVDLPEVPGQKMSVFQQLASEEPPIPSLEDSGTVGDLMIGVSDSGVGQVMAMMRGDDKTPDYVDELKARARMLDDESTQSIPAKVILENALDETTPLEAFSVDELLANIQAQIPPHQRDVRPLPSWFSESERYVLEPDFLPDSLPELDQTGGDISAQTTQPGSMTTFEQHPEALETDRLESMHRSRPATEADVLPPDSLPEVDVITDTKPVTPLPQETVPLEMGQVRPYDEIVTEKFNMGYAPPYDDSPEQATEAMPESEMLSGDTATMPAEEVEEHQADFERLGAPPIAEISEGVVKSPAPALTSDDPYIAQLALSLTQVSLELTAEATLLAREGQIVAYSGNLPMEDIEDLRDAVANDWEANPEEARIRFITLPSSGKDYMLYSRKTDGSFTLSMIFAGTMPLRVIRRQSDRLAEALSAVPETPVAIAPLAPPVEEESDLWPVEQAPELPALEPPTTQVVSVGTLNPVTYVWLIADPSAALNEVVARAILAGLDAHLTNMAWQIKTLRVHEDYIYLLVDSPADSVPQEVIHDLMRRSAEYAVTADLSLNPDTLWADSYLVVTPGHELDVEDVQRFINFARGG